MDTEDEIEKLKKKAWGESAGSMRFPAETNYKELYETLVEKFVGVLKKNYLEKDIETFIEKTFPGQEYHKLDIPPTPVKEDNQDELWQKVIGYIETQDFINTKYKIVISELIQTYKLSKK